MVWDREGRRPAIHAGRSLVRLRQSEAIELAAQLNGQIADVRDVDGRTPMSASELTHLVKSQIAPEFPMMPPGTDIVIMPGRDRWHAICRSPDPKRDAAFILRVQTVGEGLAMRFSLKA
jgi:hypothetical protein